jgi:hypothetical protein
MFSRIGEPPRSTLTVASQSPRVRPLFTIAVEISCAAAHRTNRSAENTVSDVVSAPSKIE